MENSTQNAKGGRINNFFNKVRSFLPWSRDSFGERKPWYKIPLLKRIFYFVLALLIAVFLWGFVLMSQNPDRERTFYDIKPYFETGSESDLIARKLTVYGDTADILKNVNITVSAPLTDVVKITPDNITATVSLNDVSKAGTYTLKVRATCDVGTVTNIEPETIEVEIDDLVSHTIPIVYDYVGELPEGYWGDNPQLLDSTVTVEGARKDLINVASAVCHIPLEGVTESINSSIPLVVLDSDGNEVDKSVFQRTIPSVTVNMTVLPKKRVPLRFEINEDDLLTDVFEIGEAVLSVDYLELADEQEVLDELEEITSYPVRLIGITEPGTYTFPISLIGLPETSFVLGGVNLEGINLKVVITEKIIEQVFEQVTIKVVGEVEGLLYEYSISAVDVKISGPARVVQGFLSSDLTVILNVDGKPAGEYDVVLEYTLSDFDLFAELEVEFLTRFVHVIIKETVQE